MQHRDWSYVTVALAVGKNKPGWLASKPREALVESLTVLDRGVGS